MFQSDRWTQFGSAMAGFMFIWAVFRQFFPAEYVERCIQRLIRFVYPYVSIKFFEYSGERFRRSGAFKSIDTYLGANSSWRAKRLRGEVTENSRALVMCLDDEEEVVDEFDGVAIRWVLRKSVVDGRNYFPSKENRFFQLTFQSCHRKFVEETYLPYVFEEGEDITAKNRLRKLHTNNRLESYGEKMMWSHIPFVHPASFDTLAIEKTKKNDIVADLLTFSKSKDYYSKIGKVWKRGYLLYGPPGTGKSTMIAAMANLLNYDVYDLELSVVSDNTELRKLLIETSNKSIIVIEDIDCAVWLCGQRTSRNTKEDGEESRDSRCDKGAAKSKANGVTLSGLLNSLDGLWSCCGEERILVVTTNFMTKLDPALIRTGRMDRHIEMSYCGFEAFKILAKNYLNLDSHQLFPHIEDLLATCNITPADVAENLIPKSSNEDSTACLEKIITLLSDMQKPKPTLDLSTDDHI